MIKFNIKYGSLRVRTINKTVVFGDTRPIARFRHAFETVTIEEFYTLCEWFVGMDVNVVTIRDGNVIGFKINNKISSLRFNSDDMYNMSFIAHEIIRGII